MYMVNGPIMDTKLTFFEVFSESDKWIFMRLQKWCLT